MELGLVDRPCVVTGASRGIGLATTILLLQEGARVLMVARDASRLEDAAAHAAAVSPTAGGRVATLALDVTEAAAPREIISTAQELFGDVDVLVNNAGTSYVLPFDELDDADLQLQWEVGVMAPLRLMRALAPDMAHRGWGRIVNVCSSAAIRTSMTNPSYSAGKAAELRLSQEFAQPFEGSGVAINAVVPGATATELWIEAGGLADQIAARRRISREAALDAQGKRSLVGRLAEPEEVAAVVVLLCSEVCSGLRWRPVSGWYIKPVNPSR